MALQIVLNHMAFTPHHIDHFVNGFTEDEKLKLFIKLEWLKNQILHNRRERFKEAKNAIIHPDWQWSDKTYATLHDQYDLRIAYGSWSNEVLAYGSRLLHDDHTLLDKLTETEVDTLLQCSAATIETKIQHLKRTHAKQLKHLVRAWEQDNHTDWQLKYQQPYLQFDLSVSLGRCHIEIFYKSTCDKPYRAYIKPWQYPNGIVTSRSVYLTEAQAKHLLHRSKRHVRRAIRRLFGPGEKTAKDLSLGELKANRGLNSDVDARIIEVLQRYPDFFTSD